jgi:hypothetical protein
VGQLNSIVAIGFLGLNLSNPVITYVNNGDWDGIPFIREKTGHTDLAAD